MLAYDQTDEMPTRTLRRIVLRLALTVCAVAAFVRLPDLLLFLRRDVSGQPVQTSPPAVAMARDPSKPCAPRVYPAESLRAGEHGITWVRYTTGDDGSVLSAEVQRSSGHWRLDAAAVEHVKTCKFKPNVSAGTLLERYSLY